MKATDIITTEEARSGFFPTPPDIAGKMLAGLDWWMIQSVLEPSAGKGDLVDAAARAASAHYRSRSVLDVDCCEIDPYLRQICKYNFSKEKEGLLCEEKEAIRSKLASDRTDEECARLKMLEREIEVLNAVDLHMVHDDFLTYHTFKQYDLILMNPPFADGDKHLLKALDIQKNGGSIACLLNAETIRNPYTARRVELAARLRELGAEIQFVDNAFAHAERAADVDVAIIRVSIPRQKRESVFFERMKKAAESKNFHDEEIHALVAGDYIEQAIQMYNVEVAATTEFIREYHALAPYMSREIGSDDGIGKSPILTLVVENDSSYRDVDIAKYMRLVRLKYWRALFGNKKFTGRLTSELQDKYRRQVERMADYEFSAFNIKQIMVEMNAEMTSGVEKAIMDLFEKLTVEHSWYPECSKNRHYYNGWKTNEAHKIGKKCIIPTYGMFSNYSWSSNTFEVSTAYAVISDIEKALNYLDGGMTQDCDLHLRLQLANQCGTTRNIRCKYFAIDLYKKGTTHIKFYPESMPLVEKLNIYAAKKRAWLPPNYGKAAYSDMAQEERAVVDAFHGNGEDGSGKTAYEDVLTKASYFLAEPVNELPALMAPAT